VPDDQPVVNGDENAAEMQVAVQLLRGVFGERKQVAQLSARCPVPSKFHARTWVPTVTAGGSRFRPPARRYRKRLP
jgi:hypothetical protein